MTRLPEPGKDENTWGEILNEYLEVAHDATGALKPGIVGSTALQNNSVSGAKLQDNSVSSAKLQDGSISDAKLNAGTGSNGQVLTRDTGAAGGFSWTSTAGSPDATTTSKGIVQLSGDLSGTAALPTVPALANKAETSTAINTGAGLTGGGDLSADRTIAINFGTGAGTVAQGNDSRITGAEQTSNKGTANGYAELNSSTVVPAAQLGSGTADTTTFLRGDNTWATTPAAPVESVAGKTGVVTLVKGDVGLSDVDNTSDVDKPVSTAQQTALDGKVNVANGGGETYFDAGNSGTAKTIDLANGNVQKLTLTNDCTITLTNPAGGTFRSVLLYVFQDGAGSRLITWPGSVKWGDAGAPELSTAAGKMDKILLDTVDGGTTWYGAAGPKGF